MIRTIVKAAAQQMFVRHPTTNICLGKLRGRRLPYRIASRNLSMVFGTYERDIQRVIQKHAANASVAYDVGAHVGFFSLFLADLAPTAMVFAFEPSPDEAQLIRDLIGCNSLQLRVSVEEFAVCDTSATLRFHRGLGSFTGILDKATESRSQAGPNTLDVKGITLDDFVFRSGHPAPDFMKIDVESAEPLVLKGAERLLADKRPRMLIEVHGPTACKETIEQLLRHRYAVGVLDHGALQPVTAPDQLRDRFRKNKWTHHILALPT